jgi:bifunctional non-homologous end joining protein LigD
MGATLERRLREEGAPLRRNAQPRWTQPMLATLTDRRFSDPEWIFERKMDGVRCLVFRRDRDVSLMSRNRKPLDNHYPELAEAIAEQGTERFVADGEVVAFERGRTSFSRLQGRMQLSDPGAARRTGIAVFLYLFDLLYLDRYVTTSLELRDRKRLLREELSFTGPLRLMSHRNAEGEAYYREACRRGWEGVIAKRASGAYVHGRSPDWLKFKCENQQELVIVGFTEPRGARRHLGALLVGYYDQGKLRYAGKVGTGFDEATLERLGRQLGRLERRSPPIDGEPPREKGVHWVRPELVAEVGFTEWTRDGRLRHPRYLGLRTDKSAREVVRERPVGG